MSEQKKSAVNDTNLKWYSTGFGQKKATVREFVLLLTFGLISYAILHLLIPPRPNLSPRADEARLLVLKEIDTIRKKLDRKLDLTETTPPSPNSTNSSSPSPNSTIKPTISLLNEVTINQWEKNLRQNLQILLQEQSDKKIDETLNTLSKDFTQLNQALKQSPSSEDTQKILMSIESELTAIESYIGYIIEKPLFWTGNKKWIEVIIWSLFGTLIYLIQQTSQYYLRGKNSNNNVDESTDAILTRRKPQYYSLILQSPFIALVILWILSLAQFNIAGVSLVFDSIPEEVLVSLAFILGLYNQVAITQLSMIVGAIFKDAWQKTLRKIEITPSCDIVEYGNFKQFSVIPDIKVKWSIWSKPPLGVIDSATGMYIAAPHQYSYDSDGKLTKLTDIVSIKDEKQKLNFQQVVIRAVREDEESISALAMIILKRPQDPDPSWLLQEDQLSPLPQNSGNSENNPKISTVESNSLLPENTGDSENNLENQNQTESSSSLPGNTGDGEDYPEISTTNPTSLSGEEAGENSQILSKLREKVGDLEPELQTQIEQLSPEKLEQLKEEISSFSNVVDLEQWLKSLPADDD